MNTTYKIDGNDAVRLAERDQLTIRSNSGTVSAGTARQIAKDDPSMVHVEVAANGWWDGEQALSELPGYNVSDYFTPDGMYLGPDEDGIEPRWNDATAEFDALIETHVASLGADAVADIARGEWDEAMTDALYAACGAEDVETMAAARNIATAIAINRE